MARVTTEVSMARSSSRLSRTYLPSDPDFLLEYMAGIASDDSDDDFDGYLLSDEDPEPDEGNDSFFTLYFLINEYDNA